LRGLSVEAINKFTNVMKIAFLSPIDQPVRNTAQTVGPRLKSNPQNIIERLLAVRASDRSTHSIFPAKWRKLNADRGWN
jgi:hypothetical protein